MQCPRSQKCLNEQKQRRLNLGTQQPTIKDKVVLFRINNYFDLQDRIVNSKERETFLHMWKESNLLKFTRKIDNTPVFDTVLIERQCNICAPLILTKIIIIKQLMTQRFKTIRIKRLLKISAFPIKESTESYRELQLRCIVSCFQQNIYSAKSLHKFSH